eukprot:TRINITY_DN2695_c0_g1_i1.p1 TRINITY_DN2695_c0_g1~~TRINITY_DN2695_c0_g1_i1.p1  ORF type:complete len:931 (+),score=356.47 TRINITY_DN2695_c0_g1_i1:53-2794(+)
MPARKAAAKPGGKAAAARPPVAPAAEVARKRKKSEVVMTPRDEGLTLPAQAGPSPRIKKQRTVAFAVPEQCADEPMEDADALVPLTSRTAKRRATPAPKTRKPYSAEDARQIEEEAVEDAARRRAVRNLSPPRGGRVGGGLLNKPAAFEAQDDVVEEADEFIPDAEDAELMKALAEGVYTVEKEARPADEPLILTQAAVVDMKVDVNANIVTTPQRGDVLRDLIRAQQSKSPARENSLARRSPNRYHALYQTPPSRRGVTPTRGAHDPAAPHRLVTFFQQLVTLFQRLGSRAKQQLSLSDIRRFLVTEKNDPITESDVGTIAGVCSHLFLCAWVPLSVEELYRRDCGASARVEGTSHGADRDGHVLKLSMKKDPRHITDEDVAKAKEKLVRAPRHPEAKDAPKVPNVAPKGMSAPAVGAPACADILAIRKDKLMHLDLIQQRRLRTEIDELMKSTAVLEERHALSLQSRAAGALLKSDAQGASPTKFAGVASTNEAGDKTKAGRDNVLDQLASNAAALDLKKRELADVEKAIAAMLGDAPSVSTPPRQGSTGHADPSARGGSRSRGPSRIQVTVTSLNRKSMAAQEDARARALLEQAETVNRKEKLKALYALMVEWRTKKVKTSEKKVVVNMRTGAGCTRQWNLVTLQDMLVNQGPALPPNVELSVRSCTATEACVAAKIMKTHTELLADAWGRIAASEGMKVLLGKLGLTIAFNVPSKHAGRLLHAAVEGEPVNPDLVRKVGHAIQTLLSRAKIRAQLTMEPHGDAARPTAVFVNIAVPSDQQMIHIATKAATTRIMNGVLQKEFGAEVVDTHVQQTSGSSMPALNTAFRIPVGTFVAELAEMHLSASGTGLSALETRELLGKQLDVMADLTPATVKFQEYEDATRCVRLTLDKSVKEFATIIDAALNGAAA